MHHSDNHDGHRAHRNVIFYQNYYRCVSETDNDAESIRIKSKRQYRNATFDVDEVQNG